MTSVNLNSCTKTRFGLFPYKKKCCKAHLRNALSPCRPFSCLLGLSLSIFWYASGSQFTAGDMRLTERTSPPKNTNAFLLSDRQVGIPSREVGWPRDLFKVRTWVERKHGGLYTVWSRYFGSWVFQEISPQNWDVKQPQLYILFWCHQYHRAHTLSLHGKWQDLQTSLVSWSWSSGS